MLPTPVGITRAHVLPCVRNLQARWHSNRASPTVPPVIFWDQMHEHGCGGCHHVCLGWRRLALVPLAFPFSITCPLSQEGLRSACAAHHQPLERDRFWSLCNFPQDRSCLVDLLRPPPGRDGILEHAHIGANALILPGFAHQLYARPPPSSQVLLLLQSSDRVAHDICDALPACSGAFTDGTSARSALRPTLVLRQWRALTPGREFRCFVARGELAGAASTHEQCFGGFCGCANDCAPDM